ncbi:probable zinc finger CCCH-type with G patch domain-containing protein at C-terminar half [Coccomyxa sp. Obi]|nr:probable zinc finger CCCH-type with G patch domain-containing protein at C-terminar half [Coccomyxa sp. Obi]
MGRVTVHEEDGHRDGSQGGTLRIGGLTLHCAKGEVQGFCRKDQIRRRKGPRLRDSSFPSESTLREVEGEESDDGAALDYIQNLAAEDSEDLPEDSKAAEAIWQAMQNFGKARLGDGPAADGRGDCWEGLDHILDVDTSSGEADTENSTDGSDSDEISIADITCDFSEGLKLEHAFAVHSQTPRMRVYSASETSGSGRRPHKGVSQGKLVPGEKQRLKRAKIDAKRAARAAAKGFDAAAIVAQLEAFVLAEGDMKAFPPMSPYANAFVQKAAGLFGLKSGQQGSGRKRFVIVAITKHTRLPEAAERERLAHMLASNDNAAAALRPLTTKPCTSGKGNRAKRGQQGKKQGGTVMPVRYNQPVGFVSSGVVDPYLVEHPVIHPALAHLAEAPELAAQPLLHESAMEPQLLQGMSPVEDMHRRPMSDAMEGVSATLRPGPDELEQVQLNIDEELLDADMPVHTGLGFGNRMGKRCLSELGSSSHSWAATVSEEENDPGDTDNVPHVKPSIFSTRAQVKRAQKKREKLLRRAALGRAGDAPRPQPPASAADAPTAMLVETSLHFGGFERHTTGFGSRMLAKYGFEGQGAGLGRNSQGRAEPISAVMRPKNLGLGAAGKKGQ